MSLRAGTLEAPCAGASAVAQVLTSIDGWCDELIAGLRDHGALRRETEKQTANQFVSVVRLVGLHETRPPEAAPARHAQGPLRAAWDRMSFH